MTSRIYEIPKLLERCAYHKVLVGNRYSSGNDMPYRIYEIPTRLERYWSNLTKLAKDGKLDPVIGRKSQIQSVTEILIRCGTKRNACLVGEPGVWRMAIAQGLAQRIAAGDVPKAIKGKQVITLDLGQLVANYNKDDYEDREYFVEELRGLLNEVEQAGNIITVIDELHTHIESRPFYERLSASNILKPALARGQLQCIGVSTLDKYKEHIAEDSALKRRFQPVLVPELTAADTILILKGLREKYENHYSLRYTDSALVAAAHLSHKYISDGPLPNKAVDLIDMAGSRVRVRHDQLPGEAGHLDLEALQGTRINEENNEAVRGQDFEHVKCKMESKKFQAKSEPGELSPIATDIEADIQQVANLTNEPTTKIEAGESSATVSEADIQQVVSACTAIPVEKTSAHVENGTPFWSLLE